MKFLLFGGNGFIGSNLAHALLAQDHEVSLFLRSSSQREHLDSRISFIEGELTNQDQLATAIAAHDVVINLAACGSNAPEDEALRQAVNVDFPNTLAELLKASKEKRFVHVSSIAAVGMPDHGDVYDEKALFNRDFEPYAVSKLKGEEVIQAHVKEGLNAVIVCPGNVIGSFAMKESQKANFNKILAGQLKIVPCGGVCLANVEDVAQGMIQAALKMKPGERYILGGDNVTFVDYFGEIAKHSTYPPPKFKIPKWMMVLLGLSLELAFAILRKPCPLDRHSAKMVSQNLYYSSEKAKRDLDYPISDWKANIKVICENLRHENTTKR